MIRIFRQFAVFFILVGPTLLIHSAAYSKAPQTQLAVPPVGEIKGIPSNFQVSVDPKVFDSLTKLGTSLSSSGKDLLNSAESLGYLTGNNAGDGLGKGLEDHALKIGLLTALGSAAGNLATDFVLSAVVRPSVRELDRFFKKMVRGNRVDYLDELRKKQCLERSLTLQAKARQLLALKSLDLAAPNSLMCKFVGQKSDDFDASVDAAIQEFQVWRDSATRDLEAECAKTRGQLCPADEIQKRKARLNGEIERYKMTLLALEFLKQSMSSSSSLSEGVQLSNALAFNCSDCAAIVREVGNSRSLKDLKAEDPKAVKDIQANLRKVLDDGEVARKVIQTESAPVRASLETCRASLKSSAKPSNAEGDSPSPEPTLDAAPGI